MSFDHQNHLTTLPIHPRSSSCHYLTNLHGQKEFFHPDQSHQPALAPRASSKPGGDKGGTAADAPPSLSL